MIISGARESEGNVDVSMGSRLVTPVFLLFTSMQFLSLRASSEISSESGVRRVS